MNTGFVIYSLLMIGLAGGLRQSLRHYTHTRMVPLLFIIHSIGILLTALFRDDPMSVGNVMTPAGVLHNLSAITGCVALVLAMLVFAMAMYRNALWQGSVKFSVLTVAFILVLVLLSQLETFDPVGGLLQRSFVVLSLAWIELVSLKCLALPVI